MKWEEVCPSIIAAFPSIVVSTVSVYLLYRNHMEQLKDQRNRNEISQLEQKLSSFYYPYLLLARKNTILYELFSKEHTLADKNFRTLIHLLEKKELSKNDRSLLDEIISNDIKINELILHNSNIVDDDNIRKLLIDSSIHYTIIVLAYKGMLDKESDRFDSFVHPNNVYGLIEIKAKELEEKMESLKSWKVTK